jgi:uracil-DNA glycosylase
VPARIVLVGEQPGDEEDRQGLPFVGPAGHLLDRALMEVGIRRADVYVTNAVKHFKWEPRGKRRLHKTPAQAEIAACQDWLDQEIGMVAPRVIVALGATALRALLGWREPVGKARGAALRHAAGAHLVATYHPSAVLRAEGEDARRLYELLCNDLRRAKRLAQDE